MSTIKKARRQVKANTRTAQAIHLQWRMFKSSLSSANSQTVSVYVKLIRSAWANTHATPTPTPSAFLLKLNK